MDIATEVDEDHIQYRIGALPMMKPTQKEEASGHAALRYHSANWQQKIAVRKRGQMFFGEGGAEIKAKINYGLLLHEILASIHSEGEAGQLITKYHIEGRLSSEDRQTLTEQLHWVFSNQQVREWFNTTWQVKTEAPIVTRSGKHHRPDRVLIDGQHAIVIDFKTGSEKPADKVQVLQYKDLLVQMGYLHTEAYILYLATNTVTKLA